MPSTIDGLLVQWGDRLFYPSNRMTASRTPVLTDAAVRQRAQVLRQRIRATVERRAPQVFRERAEALLEVQKKLADLLSTVTRGTR